MGIVGGLNRTFGRPPGRGAIGVIALVVEQRGLLVEFQGATAAQVRQAETHLFVGCLRRPMLLPLQGSDGGTPGLDAEHAEPLFAGMVATQFKPRQVHDFAGVGQAFGLAQPSFEHALTGAIVGVGFFIALTVLAQHLCYLRQLVAQAPTHHLASCQGVLIAALIEATAQPRVRVRCLQQAVITMSCHVHTLGITLAGGGHMLHLQQIASRVVVIMTGVITPRRILRGAEQDQPRQGCLTVVLNVFAAGGLGQLIQRVVLILTHGIDFGVTEPGCRLGGVLNADHIASAVIRVGQVLQHTAPIVRLIDLHLL